MSSPITKRVQHALHMKSALKQTEEENNNTTTEDLGTVGNTDSGTVQQGTRTTNSSETYIPGQDLVRPSYDAAWEQDLEGIQSMYPDKAAYIADREGQRSVDPEGFEQDLVEKTGVSGGPGTASTPGTTVINEDVVDNYEDIPSSYRRLTQLDAGKNYRGLKKAMTSEMKLRRKMGQYKGKGMSRKERLASTDIGKQIADMNFEVAGNPFQDRAGTMHDKTYTNINDDSYNVPNLNTGNNNNDNNNDNNNSGSGVDVNQSNYNLGDASKNFLDKTNEMLQGIKVPDLVGLGKKAVEGGGKLLDAAGINTGDKRHDKLTERMIDSYNDGNEKRGDRLRDKLQRKGISNTQVELMKEKENSPNKMKEDKKSDYAPFKMSGYGSGEESPLKQSKIQRGIEGVSTLFSKVRKTTGRFISGDAKPGRKPGSKNSNTVVKEKKVSNNKNLDDTQTKVSPERKKPGDKKKNNNTETNKKKNNTNTNTNTNTPKNPKSSGPTKGQRAFNIAKRTAGYGGLGYLGSKMMQGPSLPENVNITPSLTIPGGGGTTSTTTTPSDNKTTPPANVEKRTSRKITFNNVENPQYSSDPKRGPQAGPGDKVSTSNNRQGQRIDNRDKRASNRQKRRTENLAARQKRRSMRRANPTVVGGAMRDTFGGKTYDTQINNMKKSSGFKMKGYNKQ